MSNTLADTIIYQGTKEVVEQLKKESDLNVFDEYGFTPLTQAALMNKADIAKLLLKHKANPNMADTTGRTALHWAVDNHNMPLCQYLLDYKADPNAYTDKSQPILVQPILRNQTELKQILLNHGANLEFAQSYINAKLIGHRFELPGKVHLVTQNNAFILVDFEGFFLEFTLNIIHHSLTHYLKHYYAKKMQVFFDKLHIVRDCLARAAVLARYQHYNVDLKTHQVEIEHLFREAIQIIPAVYQGHAITFIRCKDWFAKCDRGANSQFEGSVVLYQMTNPSALTPRLLHQIVYQKQTDYFMHHEINQRLGLVPYATLPMAGQVVGNCSWANVEAAMPTLLFLLGYDHKSSFSEQILTAMQLYQHWQEWDKSVALQECIQRFYRSEVVQRCSLAAILSAVLFNILLAEDPLNKMRVKQIISILKNSDYYYILSAYIDVFAKKYQTRRGLKLAALLQDG